MIFDMNHVPPVARGQECDIDSLLQTIIYSPEKYQKLGSPGTAELNRL